MWENKLKAITFSFDDGVRQDIRMIELLDKYGLKGTFNLNSEKLGGTYVSIVNDKKFVREKIKTDEVRDVYKGHEIAAHTLTHPNLTEIDDEQEIIRQVEKDRLNLEKYSGRDVVGLAYPCGGTNYDERVVGIIKKNTGIKYSRTTTSTRNFDLQDELLQFNPTSHFIADDIFEIADRFLKLKTDKPQLFYIWGHSYECDLLDCWGKVEELFKKISGYNDIYYATNREVFGV